MDGKNLRPDCPASPSLGTYTGTWSGLQVRFYAQGIRYIVDVDRRPEKDSRCFVRVAQDGVIVKDEP